MSCKTEMASGVYLIYGAKSNVQDMSGIWHCHIWLCLPGDVQHGTESL